MRTSIRLSCTPVLLASLLACGPAPVPDRPEPAQQSAGDASPVQGVIGEEVTYSAGGVTLKGYLAWDTSRSGPRPGVLVVHEWWGHNEYVRRRARMLAELGYTALALDMYGDGKNTTHPADAKKFMSEAIASIDVMLGRFRAAQDLLKAHASTDPQRTAAIGYCFGGAVVLNMARAGADLDAVASFHGSLVAKRPAESGAIKPRLLVMTGAADPMIPEELVVGFEREMTLAGANYEVVRYPGAMHAFTNPAATETGKTHGMPLAYNESADADSWQRLTTLLQTTFAEPEPTDDQKAAAAQGAKNRGDLARMEEESKKEGARWTAELRAQAKGLAETRFPNTRVALTKILKGAHRAPGNPERDKYRHADKTLGFFGVKPTMTVLEYGAGAGWYTELLAPLLATRGKLIVNNGDPHGPPENRGTYYAKRFRNFLDKAPEIYGKVEVARVTNMDQLSLGQDGALDMALVVRGFHGWMNRGIVNTWLAEIHRVLKPSGVLGVVQHRAAEGTDPAAAAKRGRMPQRALIALVEASGFKLVATSEINANGKDTADHPAGVWTLPPTLRLGETDREKYLAVGESDRMTLKFAKIANATKTADSAM